MPRLISTATAATCDNALGKTRSFRARLNCAPGISCTALPTAMVVPTGTVHEKAGEPPPVVAGMTLALNRPPPAWVVAKPTAKIWYVPVCSVAVVVSALL
jgi:hypothetical protein